MENSTKILFDSKIENLILQEKKRQQNTINLIASENYTSKTVMEAQGSCLTNKYAEGYISKRFYNGCIIIDKIEEIAIQRAKKLFSVEYANVQPHSGSQANAAIFLALLKPGDIILGMKLTHGGHLTHGSKVNFSGKIYKSIFYGVNKKGKIDYVELKKLAQLYKPKLIIGGFSSYSRICNWKKIRKIADSVNAYFLADISHVVGLIIAGLYPSPFKYAHIVSTTTHKTLGGPRGGLILVRKGSEKLYQKLNSSVFPGIQGGPLMHVIAAKAIAFKEALSKNFLKLQKNILKNAKYMTKIFFKENFKIVSQKTENHLFVLNLFNKNITGQYASNILESANIIVNKNIIPNDSQNPFITSGIRIGTVALSKRNFSKEEVIKISYLICDILNNPKNFDLHKKIKCQVINLCQKHPIYIE
ncbi:serine hydroxymethyltransferase [Buchnera aphidicola]|uniref:serine hydroxymethyltransferase n=1 Tax=Buchnera aphidicola TaxID=9 RepID=UPI0031B6C9C7